MCVKFQSALEFMWELQLKPSQINKKIVWTIPQMIMIITPLPNHVINQYQSSK